MKVVEPFLAASAWPTAKKLAVSAALFVPIQLVQYGSLRLPWVSEVFDPRWSDTLFGILIPAEIVMGYIAWRFAKAGWDAAWMFYPFFGTYFLIAALGSYGAGVTISVTIVPLLVPVLVTPALFSLRQSMFVLFGAVVGMAAAAFAPSFGADLAPALTVRTLEDLGSARVIAAAAAFMLPAVVAGALLVMVLGEAFRRERAALAATRDQLTDAVGLISKYVPAEVAAGILEGTEVPDAGYRRQKVTAFFSDIVGFTDMSEEMEPEDLAVVLNEYFTEMAEIAQRHHGTVDELQGDGLILVFGAPTYDSDKQHALDAVQTAIEMQQAIGRLNEGWRDRGIDVNIRVRVGINTGVVTVGHFGTGTRLKYTVLGKHVNLAARVQAMCEPGRVLISNATWLLVRNDISASSLGERPFKGITRPVEVFEVDPA